MELIEKPYGAWMKAEPRRRNYTSGAKWLRQGSSFPEAETEKTMEREGETSGTEIVAKNPEKSAILIEDTGYGSKGTEREMRGTNIAITKESISLVTEKNLNEGRENNIVNLESAGLQIIDSKRRRTDRPNEEKSPEDAEMMDSRQNNISDPKNLIGAGSAVQARLSL